MSSNPFKVPHMPHMPPMPPMPPMPNINNTTSSSAGASAGKDISNNKNKGVPVSVSANTEFKTGTVATASCNSHSASAVFDNSTTASASVSVGNSNASLELGASAKTGVVASASGGLDKNNVYANASYSDTTEIHATAETQLSYKGVGTKTSIDAYAQTGNQVEAHLQAGANGVAVGGSVSTGSCVGVNASNTTSIKEASITTGAGVSIGDHFEAGGSGEATFKNGKATIGVSGDVAVLVGLDVDVSLTVDTKQIQKDAKALTNEVVKQANNEINNTVKSAGHEINNTAKNAGNSISKGIKKIHF